MSLQVEQLLLADQEAYFAELNGRPDAAGLAGAPRAHQGGEEKTLIANRKA